jgi:MoaA/NifB/PqqE/SkfB family radical SAM enzyme
MIGHNGGDMNFNFFKEIVDEAYATLKIKQIVLVGFGEPLLYPHLIEAIKYIKSKYPFIRVCLTTNGVLLDEKLSEALIDSGLDQMTISVNFNSREKYFSFNGSDLFYKVIENTQRFLQLLNRKGNQRLRIYIQILDELNSPQDISAFRKFWEPHLMPNVAIQVQPLVNWAGLIRERMGMEGNGERYPCLHLQNSYIVTREGNALACCMVFPYKGSNELVLGNVKEKSLKELYFKGKIMLLRKDNMNCNYKNMPTCNVCNAYRTIPNIFIKNPLYPWIGRKWL